jgi:RimJ/RimL family protein N-acetyltransferase
VAQPPRIETQRLVLQAPEVADAAAMYAYRSDPEVYRYQSWRPTGVPEVEEYIRSLGQNGFDREGTWFQLGMYAKDTRALIGDLGVHFLPPGSRQVEIGFTVSPAHQRRGFAAEAVPALIGYLFGTLGKHRVIGSVDPRNAPSIALLSKLGFRREAHFRQSIWADGEWQDDVIYALLAEEWLAANP